MNRLTLQLLGFSIFIINHVCQIFLISEPIAGLKKLGFLALFFVFVIIFTVDYLYNYKKNGTFKLSISVLLILNISMWLFDGNYWLAIGNSLLFIAFILLEKRLQLKEDEVLR